MDLYERQRAAALAQHERRRQEAVLLRHAVARLGGIHQRVHEGHASLSLQRRLE